jgi:hypothetical protein
MGETHDVYTEYPVPQLNPNIDTSGKVRITGQIRVH